MKMNTFILIDIDDVLVRPSGYLQSYIDTTNYFLSMFGQRHLSVDEKVAERFSSSGITDEWDMVPLTIAAFFEWYAENDPNYVKIYSVEKAKNFFPFGEQTHFRKFVESKIIEYSKVISLQNPPSMAVYLDCQNRQRQSSLPLIWDDPILYETLANSLNAFKSPFFARLENLLLGSSSFRKIFGFVTEDNLLSYLQRFDSPIINKKNINRLVVANNQEYRIAVFTARPNLLPISIDQKRISQHMLLPEAELALESIGVKNYEFPVVGAGSLGYLEQKYQLPYNSLLKPQAFHSLAAIMSCLIDNAIGALEKTKEIVDFWNNREFSRNPIEKIIPMNSTIRLAVFEDSISGILSCYSTAMVLRDFGYKVEIEPYGIYTNDKKLATLRKVGADIFYDINNALIAFNNKRMP